MMIARKTVFPLALLLLAILASAAHSTIPGSPSKKALETISVEDARLHLAFLASDKMKGRNTPSPELTAAGEYISGEFTKIGLEPVRGSYYQPFYLHRIDLGPLERNRLAYVAPGGDTTKLALNTDFVPYSESGSGTVGSGVVFAGYGITDSAAAYDDYAGIDARGKILLILQGRPRLAAYEGPANVQKALAAQRFAAKIERAVSKGAAGLLVVNDFFHGRLLTVRGYPWARLNPIFSRVPPPTTMPDPWDNRIPVVSVGENAVRLLFGGKESLRSILRRIDSLQIPQSRPLAGEMALACDMQITPVEIRNVVGLLPGTDPALAKEIVVIGGHYDHVGIRKAPEGQDSVFNGADDNASGTTGVIEVARAFMANDARPRRSILFMAFAGEEKGLLGSRAYVRDPLFPIADHAAMFNLDMIGRNNPDSLSIAGGTRCPALMRINEEENREIGFTLAYNIERFFFRSDQASFAQEKVPVIFYFTGEHEDYHKVSDETQKIDFEKLVRVARLCFRTAWRVANLDGRLPVVSPAN